MYQRIVVLLALFGFIWAVRAGNGDPSVAAPTAREDAAAVPQTSPTTSTAPAALHTAVAARQRVPPAAQASLVRPNFRPSEGVKVRAGLIRRWAEEASLVTNTAFYLPEKGLYSEELCLGRDDPR